MAALSKGDPSKDPVILWFNGGPGCSSMLGFFQEHGPYVLEDGAETFHENEYSWNKEASTFYIESPAGVGYSVCPDPKECIWTDNNTAADNLIAVVNMFKKFPELLANDFYISGESYAGIYVPYLAN
jgi:carboxypeptidase C (cathepsin A)